MLTQAFVLGALTCKTAYFIAPALWKYEVRCSRPRNVILNFSTNAPAPDEYSLN